MKFEYIIAIFLVLIIIFLINRYYFSKEKLKNIEKKDELRKEQLENKEKILQYFGGDYCPFSNTTSNAYKVIKDFEHEYDNKIIVKYYWVGKDDDYMKQLNVEYVPAILNGNNEEIELALPEGTNTKEMSTEQIKQLLLETIFNKL
jgi:hypothetical protein